MKANRADIEGALRSGARDHRFLLLHGPDEAGSRALASTMAAAFPADAERIDLAGAELRSDPARLADEAASISLFGGARFILVEPAGEEVIPALEALLEAPQAGNPVVIVAGALRQTSRLLKLALAEPRALAFASYVPEGRDAERLVVDLATARSLALDPDVARRLAEAGAGNRALIERELEKFALYLDASPERPKRLEHEHVALLGAGAGEGDLSRLVDGVGSGDARQLEAELTRLAGEGVPAISLIRAVLRRMLLLARMRADVERGKSVESVMTSQGKSLFWKEKPSIGRQLSRWNAPLLAKSVSRLVEAERQAKASGALGAAAVEEELFAICRQAARLR